MSLIEKFCDTFSTTVEDWEYWKEENDSSDKLIIAGPSRIIGLVDLSDIEDEIEWETYSIKAEPKKSMSGNFVYNGNMYGIKWLTKIFHLLDETFEVAKLDEAILFRMTETVALGLGEKRNPDDFYYNDEGVMFIEWDWEDVKEEWRSVVDQKEFIKWENNMAKRKHKGKSHIWYEELYRFEYFFEEEEDVGDMMLR